MDQEINEKKSIDRVELNKERIFLNLIWEILLFSLFLGLILWSINNLFKKYLYLVDILMYPAILVCFLFWLIVIKKDNPKNYLLGRPSLPKNREKYVYLAYAVGFVVVIILWLFLLSTGLGNMNVTTPYSLVVEFFRMCICAPIVEEIIFRSYFYARIESLYGVDSWRIENKKIIHDFGFKMENANHETSNETNIEANNKADIQKFHSNALLSLEITSAAIISSIFFSLWHLDPFKAIPTFAMGLLLCKIRNNCGKTLIIPILVHFSLNFYIYLGHYTNSDFVQNLYTNLFSNFLPF